MLERLVRPGRGQCSLALILLVVANLFAGTIAAAEGSQGPIDVEPEALRPGLVASYRSLGDEARELRRIDPKPAFTLGRSPPHPRLPAGPFEVLWNGVLFVQDPGPITFHAFLGGKLS